MILGVGIDILETQRMAVKAKDPGFLKRFMHPDEIAYAQESKEDPAMTYASRFAAKEAFGKALGIGLRGLKLRDIAVDHDAAGRPFLSLYGTALDAYRQIGGSSTHLSLSHQDSIVAAVVIIEGDSRGGE
ncbi:MAG: holo-ACP synthase [Bacteroidetes bacterium]|nr:holo-ACP synthase [Bacteroidota bacterium]